MVVYDDKNPKEKKHIEELKTRKGFELLSVSYSDPAPKAFKPIPVVEDTLECPLCGTVCKDDATLLEHKETHFGKPKKK